MRWERGRSRSRCARRPVRRERETATSLLREIRRRITEGSHRLSRALHQMYSLRDAQDLAGARQQMRDLLAVEVVPHYRDIAEGQLERLDEPSPSVRLSHL